MKRRPSEKEKAPNRGLFMNPICTMYRLN